MDEARGLSVSFESVSAMVDVKVDDERKGSGGGLGFCSWVREGHRGLLIAGC